MKNSFKLFLLLIFAVQASFSQKQMEGVVQNYFNSISEASDSKKADLSEWKITDIVPSLNPQIQHVYVQQYHKNIPIQFASYKLTVKDNAVTWKINQFIDNISSKTTTSTPSITSANAIMKTVSNHNLKNPSLNGSKNKKGVYEYKNSGISDEPIKAELMYQNDNGILKLVWNVSLYQKDGKHWWSENIDATTGQVLRTEDWVISCSFEDPNHAKHDHDNETLAGLEKAKPFSHKPNASVEAFVGGGSYNVYPLGIESPNHGNRTIVTDPANALASPYGWHDTNGSPGAEFTTTRGNNVLAQDDTNGNNGTGVSPNGGSTLNFDFPLNLNNSPSTFLPAATTNLFYWNNIMHDVWYQYGFNEASGNFQENNYGRGGAGSDSVNADAQDGSSSNNANFSTPPDGGNPRMQMFLFTSPTRDGDLDNVIIAHEYGHGISTRLVGGPGTNALGGSEQMGEGWSDWLGLVLTIRPGDDRNTARGVGTYAVGQATTGGGIRPTRYSTDFAVNGTDYSDISGLAVPHGVGYGFATILWDMTWDLIDLEGYDSNLYTGNGGNNVAMALVIEGLKNTANNPGYVSGRNGILQADQDLYGGKYNCLIWDAFAKRGVGVDAVENTNGGTNTNNDQITSFTSGCAGDPTPIECDSTVANFPYNEGFENTLGAWSQGTNDDFNWALNTGGTPSNSTGPSGAFEGTHYIYVEASDPNFGGKSTILNSPCFNLTAAASPSANFHYQMTGNSVGTIRLEVRVDGEQTWTEVWSKNGDQGVAWVSESVSLSAYTGATVQLRFRGTTNSSWQGDIAIDAFSVTTSNADTQAPTAPTSLLASGTTQTTTNLSWTASTDNVGVTEYEVFQGGSSLGTVAETSASVSGLTPATTYSFTVKASDAAGNVSASSNAVSVTTLSDTTSGCTTGISSFPYGESFESGLGAWTQASGDDLNWTRDSGGTPSANTGPTSGSAGSWYLFVEASDPNFPSKSAILNSPCFNLGGVSNAFFTFDYHMFGANDLGSIAIELSNNNGGSWTSIWNQSGASQGNAWQSVSLDLSAYIGGSVQLRFVRITGNTWQADIAIDNVKLLNTAPNTDICAGVAPWSSTTSYSPGDLVTYQGNLFERTTTGWTNLGACGSSLNSLTAGAVIYPPNTLDISLYPNPVKGNTLYVRTTVENLPFTVVNMLGQQVAKGTSTKNGVNVSELEAGLYLIQFNVNDQVISKKFMKQ